MSLTERLYQEEKRPENRSGAIARLRAALDEAEAPREIALRSIRIKGDIGDILQKL